MGKLYALFDLFRKGSAVADPALWKKRQITATVLAAFLLSIANASGVFGHQIPLDAETANSIAVGILGLFNVVFTVTTSDKIGLPAKASGGAVRGDDPPGDGQPPAPPQFTG